MQGKLVVSENSIKYIVSRYSEEKNKIQGERWGIKAKIATISFVGLNLLL